MPVEFITNGADSGVLNPRGGYTGSTFESVRQVGSEEVRKEIARTNASLMVPNAGISGSRADNQLSGETFARITSELKNGEIDMFI